MTNVAKQASKAIRDARAVVILITSDQHAGSTTALCPPTVRLDDGGEYVASKPQQWMYQKWQALHDAADTLRTKEKAALVEVFNGDMVDGDHHGTTQILSGNPNAQAAVVNAIMRAPLALGPDAMFFIRGTEAHVGKSAAAEERISDGLRRDKRPVIGDDETGTASHWHKKMEIQGVRFDFAHHGRVGTRPWTKPNVVANLAAEIFMDHAQEDAENNASPSFPHIAVRSHMHQLVDTGQTHKVRVIQTAAWQLATSFIHRIAPGKLADIGGTIILIKDGVADVRHVLFRPTRSPAWKP